MMMAGTSTVPRLADWQSPVAGLFLAMVRSGIQSPKPRIGTGLARAAALLVLVAGCDRQESGGSLAGFVVVSGDSAGWIVPCGCATNQSGGMPRRGTFVRELRRRGEVIVVDAGGVAASDTEYQRAKFEAILTGAVQMGLAAQNIGAAEARFGPSYLRDVARRLNVPLVSANVRDADGNLIAPAVRLVRLAGRTIAVAGVMARPVGVQSAVARELQVDEPREAILRVLAEDGQHYDSLLVLGYLPETELRELAAGLPEADAVIGGPTGQALVAQRLGPTLLASATNKGKFLVQLDAHLESRRLRWSGQVVEMSDALADDADQLRNLRGYLAELRRRDFTAERTGFAPMLTTTGQGSSPRSVNGAAQAVAGTASCRECHAAEYAVWEEVDHAHAWADLKARGYEVDPYCQQCHTTGYGYAGGFVSAGRSADRTNVGCENCHGPSAAHVREPKVRTPFVPQDQCIRCHDLENSPKFEFDTYWAKIRHGPKATSTTAASMAAPSRGHATGGPSGDAP